MISDYLHAKQDAARGMLGMWLTDVLRPVCYEGDIMASPANGYQTEMTCARARSEPAVHDLP